MHGEKIQFNGGCKVIHRERIICALDIPRGAMLLANNEQKIYCNQVVAEIKEDQRNIYTEVREVFLQNVKVKKALMVKVLQKKPVRQQG